jgi:hypothetical protein
MACGKSKNIQLQLKGRDLRLPVHLGELHKNVKKDVELEWFKDFCTVRYYYPKGAENAASSTEWAFDFILDMDERALAFMSWRDLLHGKSPSEIPAGAVAQDPFTHMDGLMVESGLSAIKASKEEITEEDIEHIVCSLPKLDPGSRRARQAREHAEGLARDPEYRAREVEVNIGEPDIIRPITRQQPKKIEDYEIEDLIPFVQNSPDYELDREDVIKDLSAGDIVLKNQVAKAKRRYDGHLFTSVPKIMQLRDANGQEGLLDNIADKLVGRLLKTGHITRKTQGNVYRAVTHAVCTLVGKEYEKDFTANDGPLDHPSYHQEFCQTHCREQIVKLACRLLRRWKVTTTSNLYADVI